MIKCKQRIDIAISDIFVNWNRN